MPIHKELIDDVQKEIKRCCDELEKLEEEIFLGFRKTEGIDCERIKEKFDIDFEIKYANVLKKYSDNIKNDLKRIIDLINNDTTTKEINNQSVRDEAFNKVILYNSFLREQGRWFLQPEKLRIEGQQQEYLILLP